MKSVHKTYSFDLIKNIFQMFHQKIFKNAIIFKSKIKYSSMYKLFCFDILSVKAVRQRVATQT